MMAVESHTWWMSWSMVAFALGAIGGFLLWVKRKTIDDVFATKSELMTSERAIRKEIKEVKEQGNVAYSDLSQQITKNHDEIKDLIITHLSKD